jgi:hypothetical protein
MDSQASRESFRKSSSMNVWKKLSLKWVPSAFSTSSGSRKEKKAQMLD